jgi:high frequency lysogenization protein
MTSVLEELSLQNTSAKYTEWEYRNIALAVVAQCAQLVHSLATTGRANPRQVDACIAPLLVLEPDSVDDIYPDVSAFSSGLAALQHSLSNEGVKEFAEPIRYVLGMTVLQQQLMAVPAMQTQIRQRLQIRHSLLADKSALDAEAAGQDESDTYDFAVLAALYQDTISRLTMRIHVKGTPEHLRKQQVADKIRALLLAGIRSALLWHQLGGRRWHLFIYKKRIRECVAQIRRSLINVH